MLGLTRLTNGNGLSTNEEVRQGRGAGPGGRAAGKALAFEARKRGRESSVVEARLDAAGR